MGRAKSRIRMLLVVAALAALVAVPVAGSGSQAPLPFGPAIATIDSPGDGGDWPW